MTDEEIDAIIHKLWVYGTDDSVAALAAIRWLRDQLDQARIAGAWLYKLELDRPGDYAEQKRLAMAACRVAFRHPQELS